VEISFSFVEWMVPFIVGLTFTIFGSLKLYGVVWGIEGGRDKPAFQYVCGTRPSWKSRGARLALPLLFLAIGLGELCWAAWRIYTAHYLG